ncbi:MAG TPA: hypothetical protein VGR46_16035 [Candidatus Limnocylindria bacterium]|nr:hypothetical protein [Candidatus Limnocylindria bacterium]
MIVERYLYTAMRYRWVIAAVLLILASSGSVSAYGEYVMTYESASTIWVERTTQNILTTVNLGTDQPQLPNFQTPANEFAEVLGQLVQTQTFLRDVIARTSSKDGLASASDQLAYLDDARKRFRVQALGMNLVKVSFRARSPELAFEMVSAALAVRDERTTEAQLNAQSVTSAFYQKEFELAQAEALRAGQQLDAFNKAHAAVLNNLNAADDYTQRQLRLGSDLAQVRLNDLKTRIDRAGISSALLQLTRGADIQVIDRPQVEPRPSGGLRQAAFLFGVALSGAAMLIGLIVVLGTLLTASVTSEADIGRLGQVTLLVAIPQVGRGRGGARAGGLLATLATVAFGSGAHTRPADTTAAEVAS